MEFPQAKVKSIKADLVNKEITISFTVGLNEDSQAAAENLSQYVDKDMGKVEVRVIPQQLPLMAGAILNLANECALASMPEDWMERARSIEPDPVAIETNPDDEEDVL